MPTSEAPTSGLTAREARIDAILRMMVRRQHLPLLLIQRPQWLFDNVRLWWGRWAAQSVTAQPTCGITVRR